MLPFQSLYALVRPCPDRSRGGPYKVVTDTLDEFVDIRER